jgi:hypothetical protein
MPHVLVRHQVNDYEIWRQGFDAAGEMRKEAGELSFQLFNGSDNPLLVVGLFEWKSLERAKTFFEDLGLKEAMVAAGVVGEPDVNYLTSIPPD